MQAKSLALGVACAILVSGTALGSSHREAPFITKYPQVVRHEALCLLAAVSAAQEAVTHRTWYRVLGLYGQPCRSSVDREVIGRKPSG